MDLDEAGMFGILSPWNSLLEVRMMLHFRGFPWCSFRGHGHPLPCLQGVGMAFAGVGNGRRTRRCLQRFCLCSTSSPLPKQRSWSVRLRSIFGGFGGVSRHHFPPQCGLPEGERPARTDPDLSGPTTEAEEGSGGGKWRRSLKGERLESPDVHFHVWIE